jgi:hypothetical protein
MKIPPINKIPTILKRFENFDNGFWLFFKVKLITTKIMPRIIVLSSVLFWMLISLERPIEVTMLE